MIVLLTNITFDEFRALPNKEEYIKNSNFFYMRRVGDKTDVVSVLDTVAWWYSIWEKTPLYVTVVADRSWNVLVKDLNIRKKISISKTVPDDQDDPSKYKMILEKDRIFSAADIARVSDKIFSLKFNNSLRYYSCNLVQ